MAKVLSDNTKNGSKGPISIHGIPVDDPTNVPIRLEIRELAKKEKYKDLWNLYLLGLERFKDKRYEKQPLSYFQIAGIHGRPYTTWPAEEWNKEMEQVQQRGFCTHSSILFLTWHRPYLALFETMLYSHINEIAEEFKEKGDGRYIAPAKSFRMPYWDWALPADDLGVFPAEALPSAKHTVTRPGGKTEVLTGNKNPLASYEFGDVGKANKNINWFPGKNATARYYDPTTGVYSESDLKTNVRDLTTNPEEIGKDRSRQTIYYQGSKYYKGRNLTERAVYLLQSYDAFAPMSYNLWLREQGLSNYGSLEDIHNSVHGYTGGGGHMSYPEVAAFDPIFWLHHTNIDRMFAIWQALHDDKSKPETYVTEKQSITGTFTTGVGAPEDAKTPLTPFHKTENLKDFWKSEDVRGTDTFGYMYSETQLAKKDLLAKLQELYPNGSFANTAKQVTANVATVSARMVERRAESHALVDQRSVDTKTIIEAVEKHDSKAIDFIASEAKKVEIPTNRSLEDLVIDNKYLEWLVDVKAEKHALGGDYFVHFFIGDPDDAHPQLYTSNPTHVASFNTFGQNADTGCEKCKVDQANRAQVTGQIPLTMALVERYLAGHVTGLTPDVVIPFLQTNLHWRVTSLNGEPRPRNDVDQLLVSVVTNEVTLPAGPSDLPRYAPNVVPRPEVTTKPNATDGRGDGTGYTGREL